MTPSGLLRSRQVRCHRAWKMVEQISGEYTRRLLDKFEVGCWSEMPRSMALGAQGSTDWLAGDLECESRHKCRPASE